ncbi:hypothetical protein [Microbulbifer agarilyticus]|nr:hypothetical protein [Microbulbifer agarilyticus]
MKSAQLGQLERIKKLRHGLEWASMCPDPEVKEVMTNVLGEEMDCEIDGAIYAIRRCGEAAGE